MDYKFWLDGVCSLDKGIALQGPVTFDSAAPRVTSYQVPGRNGDLHWFDGSYDNVTGTAKCFLLDAENVAEKIQDVHNFFLSSDYGYRRLETSEEPDIFRLAIIKNLPQTDIRMKKLLPFDVQFDCDPRCFLKSGETDIEISKGSKKITNPCNFNALPLIHVTGSGTVKIQVNGTEMSVSGHSDFWIDCENMSAYTESGDVMQNIDADVSADEYPVLKAGENEISAGDGVKKLVITPRWCYV